MSSAGDVNGDGFNDLLIGALGGDALGNTKGGAGESYVIFGGASLPTTINLANLGAAGIKIFGVEAKDYSGVSVSSAGDMNGDGYDDLLVGCESGDASGNTKRNAGENYLIFGGASLPTTIDLATLGSAGVTIFGADAGDYSGSSVSGAGDVNGDGFDDLLLGARGADARYNSGESYVIFGRSSLPTTIDLDALGSAGVSIFGADAGDFNGRSVSGAGDVNGDGFDDLLIGASGADASDNALENAGESYVIFGRAVMPATIDLATLGSASIKILGADAGDYSGSSVSSAGDVNGDGFDDLLIGAPRAAASGNARSFAGESYVIFGRDFSGAVTHQGAAASQTLTGTADADVMIGGRGNDILVGNGATDVLRGGEGNDVLAISDLNFKRLVGGTGSDTLRLDGSGLSLNLTTLRDNRLLGIEQINLTGSGNNTLTINQHEVLNISDESNTLVVRRNTGDVVNIVDIDSWTQAANETLGSDVFRVYTQGTATLKVQEQSGDVVAPTIFALSPADNAVNVAVAANLVVTFSENVQKGVGNLLIKRMSDNTTFATIPVTDAQVSVSGAIVTINPPANLNSGTSYYLQIAAGAFEDSAGNDFAGIFDNSTWNFATATTQLLVVSSIAVSVPEGGTNTFTVRLNTQPAANVTVNGARTSGDTNLTVSGGASLTFTTANWNIPQTITLAAAEDADLANGAAVFNVTSTGLTAVIVTATEADNDSGPTNVAPVIGAFDTTVSYTENAVPILIDANATVIDVDSANFAGGKLTVAVSANGQTTDRIGIRNVGNLAGQIGVSGTTVSYGGVAIGTFAGTTSLVVTLNDKSSPVAVQALLRSVTFSSLSENPAVLDRTIKVILTDGDGGTSNLPTKLVKVVAVNDAPVIGAFDTTVTWTENADPLVIDSNATVIDVDSANLAGGKLAVSIAAHGQGTDRIGIKHTGNAAGQIGVSGITVSYGGVAIGTFAGTTSLVVTLNEQATPLAVQALLRSVTFASVSENPSTLDRTLRVSLTDGDGGASNLPTKLVKVVAVNDPPVINAFDTTVAYVAGGAPVVLDGNVTVSDSDSTNFDTGVLTVSVIAGGDVSDRIEVRNQGSAVGQIGVSGLNVTYGGGIVGTFLGTTSLTIRLNSTAAPAVVQALLRNITFRSTSATPSTADRTIKVTLTDGDGGTSTPSTKLVTVSSGVSSLPTGRAGITATFLDLDHAFSGELIETDLLVS